MNESNGWLDVLRAHNDLVIAWSRANRVITRLGGRTLRYPKLLSL